MWTLISECGNQMFCWVHNIWCSSRKKRKGKEEKKNGVYFQSLGCGEPWPGPHSTAAYKIGSLYISF